MDSILKFEKKVLSLELKVLPPEPKILQSEPQVLQCSEIMIYQNKFLHIFTLILEFKTYFTKLSSRIKTNSDPS